MTNQELLGLTQTIGEHKDKFKTASGKYMVIKNIKKMTDALAPYYETLKDISEEYDVDLSGNTIPSDAPDEFTMAVNDLLQEDVNPGLHMITEKTLKKEEEKGNDIDFDVLMQLQSIIQ